ncbi:hypothetical protein FACS189493_6660 [Spirochaetia bacterium]|nr:hypothetical protein FACS189493_6660 [Spirochaetia bacterium]
MDKNLKIDKKRTFPKKKHIAIASGIIVPTIIAIIGLVGNSSSPQAGSIENATNVNNIGTVNGNVITNINSTPLDIQNDNGHNILNTSDANELYKIAANCFHNEDFLEAIDIYSSVIDKDKYYAQAYLDRGASYAHLKKWKKATRDFWYVKINFPQINNISQANESYPYVQNMWSDSTSFVDDINRKEVSGIVNDKDGLILRKEPYVREESNKIRTLRQNEIVTILSRSEVKQKIRPYDTYWYKVETEKSEIGWVYGWFLDFFPSD